MSMAAADALRVALSLLVGAGLAALHLGGLLGTGGAVLVAVVAATSWWAGPLRERLARVRWLPAVLGVVAAGGLLVDLLALAPSMLDAFTHLLVFLLLYKLYTRRSLRDARDIAFLAFFMLVAVAPITFGVTYLALFAVFLVAGTWLLLLRHLLLEAEEAGARRPAGARALGLGRELLAVSLAAAVAMVAVTAALFFVIPRVGQAALPLRAQATRLVSGFSERVELGAFGEIEADTTVVMRVHLPRAGEALAAPEQLAGLRWRGIAFDRFDGRAWTVGEALRLTLRRHQPVAFPINRYQGGPVLTQEIYLEPIGTEMIFGAPRMLRLQGRADFVTVDDLGNVSIPLPAARLRYTIDSEPEVGDPRRARQPDAGVPDDPLWRARYTQLPPALPPRIGALAREVTREAGGPYDAALALTAFLSREFTYTRVLARETALDPLEEFLFERRAGNCEYFAAALAVMLRALDIPARVVNGFQRGEWNPYGRYFMVRLRDAHSWVEVFVDGAGWVTLDPSPRGAGDAPAAPVAATLYLDALRLRWYRYVINWSLHDQLTAALAVRRTATSLGSWSWEAQGWDAAPRAAAAGVALALLGAGALAWRRAAAGGGAPRLPRFYERALRALARRALAPSAGETAREFAARVARAAPAWAAPLARITAGYERVRFGGLALAPAEAEAVEGDVAALEGGR